MTIKSRISLLISITFTVLFGIVSIIIIILFSDFRRDEFKERLNQKALTTINLLKDVKEVNNTLLKTLDKYSTDQLYNEKTLIFDTDFKLIYSSLEDRMIHWTLADLNELKIHKTFFREDGENEVYGIFYNGIGKDFYILISAHDNYGKRKLEFLILLLIGAYALFTALAWVITFFLIKKQLFALDYFHRNISNINENNLDVRLDVRSNSKNEIDLIGKEFNFMMNRIEEAYKKQKEFTSNASHELRTPLARISTQLENMIQKDKKNENLQNIFQNINQLNELIQSLLILAKIDTSFKKSKETARVDEAIYNSIEMVHHQFSNFKVSFEIEETGNLPEEFLEIKCNQHLLEIAFSNLLKNAYLYSNNHQANIKLSNEADHLKVVITNSGSTLTDEEVKKLFQPFVRGGNSKNIDGLGLGLRIVHRILNVYHFKINYQRRPNQNIFTIDF